MKKPILSQLTLLPEQFRRLAEISAETGAAIGIAQTGSVIHVNTGREKFDINAHGETIVPKEQEQLC